jgi:hypothetical protein
MQACWQRPKGNCISSKHALSFMYPVCPSIISKREESNAQMYGMITPFSCMGFHMYTYPTNFFSWPTGAPGGILFPFFKSALIEGDTSICCVFLRLMSDMVTLVKLRSSYHDQSCCFFVAARRGRRASRRQGRRGGLARHGFLARPALREG